MSQPAPLTERSAMKTRKHSYKKPLLQEQVSQKDVVKTNIMFTVSMIGFAVMIGYTFASVFG